MSDAGYRDKPLRSDYRSLRLTIPPKPMRKAGVRRRDVAPLLLAFVVGGLFALRSLATYARKYERRQAIGLSPFFGCGDLQPRAIDNSAGSGLKRGPAATDCWPFFNA